jgi:hypothetical protein
METDQEPTTRMASSLGRLRIIWAALLLGQVSFLAVILFLIYTSPAPEFDESLARILSVVEVVMLVTMLPAAFLLRKSIWARGLRPDGHVAPESFATGTIVFLAMLEGTAIFGEVVMLLTRHLLPYGVVPLIAFLVQVVCFPRGEPLAD